MEKIYLVDINVNKFVIQDLVFIVKKTDVEKFVEEKENFVIIFACQIAMDKQNVLKNLVV